MVMALMYPIHLAMRRKAGPGAPAKPAAVAIAAE
jgi:hypothetical protein